MGRIKNIIRNLNYLSKNSLWDDKEAQVVYLTNKIISDASYEFELGHPQTKELTILSTDETLSIIEKGKKSFVRTGDGEIQVMMGLDHCFQKRNEEVANRLIDLLEHPRDNLLVGINRNYFIPLYPLGNPPFYRRYAYEFRNFYLEHCKESMIYIDAGCIGIRSQNNNQVDLERHYDRWRKLFLNEDIVIVCGYGILDNLEYDVFELAKSKSFIYGPKHDAWDEHENIIKKIVDNVSTKEILVFILGQGGKAMIPELVDRGYTCWDVGHLAKYYNAVMTKMEWNKENTAKFYAPD